MKKLFILLFAAVLCVSLGAASVDWTDVWAEGFPDWTVDVHTSAYPDEEGRYLYEIMMTRVEDGALRIRSVRFDLPEGQETVPDDAKWVVYPPIPVSEAAAEPAWLSPSFTSNAAHLPSRISTIASTSSPSESR